LAALAFFAGCVTVGPTGTAAPTFTLAPGQTPTAVPPPTPVVTLPPGVTPAPVTPAPVITPEPVVTPEVTPPLVTLPPTLPPTEPPEHPNWPLGAIAGRDAHDHIGETLVVCGKVASVNWVFAEKGHPTWINFGQPYPSQRFNAVIWGEQRREWSLNNKPEVMYPGHEICVGPGLIEEYGGWPQIQDLHKVDIQIVD
jgi:hypothetical protein